MQNGQTGAMITSVWNVIALWGDDSIMKMQDNYIKQLDVSWSYRLAKKMEQICSNPKLGYRTAGSPAELATGDMLAQEMRQLGFPKVYKDAIRVDSWEFQRAELTYQSSDGEKRTVQLGAYQTQFVTEGPQTFSLIYAGKGTRSDYEGLDVAGKLVLVDINQRDEWWISYPVYQAHLKGAAAVIAAQAGGYGEVDETSLNAQDIAGPCDAPAFSVSGKDAEALKQALDGQKEITVLFDAVSRVNRDQTTYNIIGEIPGRHPERRILLSAHYDSYFDGFQDDNTAVSMMLCIGKTLLEIGYQPENTLTFCAMAAEEWGVIDSQFDWSTGAYEQVFTVHPEWRGSAIADLNFELPALAHGTRARIRSTWEYVPFLETFLEELPALTPAYPEETGVTAPIETWSDDFSIAIFGIPSMVNDFTGGSFMETNYHSQFDNDNFYDEDVYRMHHELFGLLLMALDRTAVVPLSFSGVLERAAEKLELPWCKNCGADGEGLVAALEDAAKAGISAFDKALEINHAYALAQKEGRSEEAQRLFAQSRHTEQALLAAFSKEQDTFVRIDWHGNVLFPHRILQDHLRLLSGAVKNLKEGRISAALRKLYQVDNNSYAFAFEKEVYEHFTQNGLLQPKERLKWGYGRIIGHEDLFDVVTSLLEKEKNGETDCHSEIAFLEQAHRRQSALYRNEILKMQESTREIQRLLKEAIL